MLKKFMRVIGFDAFELFFIVFISIVLAVLPTFFIYTIFNKKNEVLFLHLLLNYWCYLTLILMLLFDLPWICVPFYEMSKGYLGEHAEFCFIFMQVFTIFACLSCVYFVAKSFLWYRGFASDVIYCLFIYSFASLGFFYIDDFIILYLLVELQGLSAYVLASAFKNSTLSIEAGLKYFILGSIASGFLLFGMSMLYGYFGTLLFSDLRLLLYGFQSLDSLVVFAFVFICSGLFFKIGLFPFHSWVPDVYEGAPLFVTALFALVPKIPLVYFFCNIYLNFIYVLDVTLVFNFNILCLVFSSFSVVFGVFGAFYQNTIQRLVAYSGIANIGYVITALFLGSLWGVYSAIFFTVIYVFLMLNFFLLCFLIFKNSTSGIYYLSDLSFLGRFNPNLAYYFAVVMFSLAGIPPLAGFFSKVFILNTLVLQEFFFVVAVVALLSTFSAIYYIRIVKLMFFDKSFMALGVKGPYFHRFLAAVFTGVNCFFLYILESVYLLFVSFFL